MLLSFCIVIFCIFGFYNDYCLIIVFCLLCTDITTPCIMMVNVYGLFLCIQVKLIAI